MSWLTDFTSKAENFLNKIDQSAAETLSESKIDQSESLDHRIGEINVVKEPQIYNGYQEPIKQTPPLTPINVTGDKHPAATNLNHSADAKISVHKATPLKNEEPTNLSRSSSSPSLKKHDDILFEFLNSNNPVVTKTHTRNLSGPKTSTPRKVTHITSSVASKQSETSQSEHKNNVDVVDSKPVIPPEKVEIKTQPPPPPTQMPEYAEVQQAPSNGKGTDDFKKNDERISNLELENKLLKNEMHSLNGELASTLKNLKEQQQETEKYKLRYENRRNRQNEDYERMQKQSEDHEADLSEALKAKDSQLAVLRVRITEVDAELKEKTKILEDVQGHNERMFKDHSDASGVQTVALDNIKNKLETTESQLRLEQTENRSIKAELMNLQSKLQNEQQQYADTIKQLQSSQSEGKGKSRELEMKVKSFEDTTDVARKELKDYKDKAARILQAKEKLIASLRQGSDSTELSPMLLSELEEVKQERDLLRDELQQNKYNTEQLRSEYLDLELQHNTETNENEQKIESLQSSLQEECQKRQHAEEDMKRYMQELQFTREDLLKIKKTHGAQNQQYESELKKLQNQVNAKAKQTANSSQEELENRIRTLTDSLIHKQTMVDALSTEKNSLVLQLERLEKQYHDVQNSLTRRNKDHSTDIEDPESGTRLQPMASIMPSQITQNRRWKKTANDIDKFSIGLGVFLRRYPVARLMVIFYML